MLSDNIKKYRKANNMSQDELAQRLNVSRQSVSLWENGQSQPTIDNIIALTRIFGISSDELLDNITERKEVCIPKEEVTDRKNSRNKAIIIGIIVGVIVSAAIILICLISIKKPDDSVNMSVEPAEATAASTVQPQTNELTDNSQPSEAAQPPIAAQENGNTESDVAVSDNSKKDTNKKQESEPFDLFNYCKNFAIQKGELNGDYCIYQQPSSRYGGYDNEYFSVSYWGDSDMVEFCLHCPLDDTLSINFYLRMRGGYDGKYEYLSSKYYRSDGVSLREASGYINPAEFSKKYPLYCDEYIGSTDGQNEFMEESRVGMCDLIKCLKRFVEVENMDCDFEDFGFANF